MTHTSPLQHYDSSSVSADLTICPYAQSQITNIEAYHNNASYLPSGAPIVMFINIRPSSYRYCSYNTNIVGIQLVGFTVIESAFIHIYAVVANLCFYFHLQAQWFIFDKVKAEGFTGNEYAKLRCDVIVPKKMVGRIIGESLRHTGQNVITVMTVLLLGISSHSI